MWRTIAAVVALAVAVVAYYLDSLVRKRRQLDGLVSTTSLNFNGCLLVLAMEFDDFQSGLNHLQRRILRGQLRAND